MLDVVWVSIAFAFGLALLLVYMILAAIFESFVTPFVLLFSIPLAAIGSFFLLTVTGESLFNANTIMGFLILLGVVVNNGIILIDYINELRKRGYRKTRAILEGGLYRVRPILITAVTTCAAMIPLALGNAEYVEAIGPPFAITVIGGLSLSTLLTLIYIPMLYNGIEQALAWIGSQRLLVKLILLVMVVAVFIFAFLGFAILAGWARYRLDDEGIEVRGDVRPIVEDAVRVEVGLWVADSIVLYKRPNIGGVDDAVPVEIAGDDRRPVLRGQASCHHDEWHHRQGRDTENTCGQAPKNAVSRGGKDPAAANPATTFPGS